jgi:hypothetical protein
VLVTHEHDIAEFASRTIAFRDGHVVDDRRHVPRVAGEPAVTTAPPAPAAPRPAAPAALWQRPR